MGVAKWNGCIRGNHNMDIMGLKQAEHVPTGLAGLPGALRRSFVAERRWRMVHRGRALFRYHGSGSGGEKERRPDDNDDDN